MPTDPDLALVIGAGPAGLTAAYELATRTDLRVVVLEATDALGGISQTVVYKGNRIDIGGHRFFSKSDRVLDWWLDMLPSEAGGAASISYQNKTRDVDLEPAEVAEHLPAFMVRERTSRIYFAGQFFDYPISLSPGTLRKLGARRTARIGASYVRAHLRPIRPEATLEDFFINRFGRELYQTFFREYTEKVWGVPCHEIPAEWGAQRVKGLSVARAIGHFARGLVPRRLAGRGRRRPPARDGDEPDRAVPVPPPGAGRDVGGRRPARRQDGRRRDPDAHARRPTGGGGRAGRPARRGRRSAGAGGAGAV